MSETKKWKVQIRDVNGAGETLESFDEYYDNEEEAKEADKKYSKKGYLTFISENKICEYCKDYDDYDSFDGFTKEGKCKHHQIQITFNDTCTDWIKT